MKRFLLPLFLALPLAAQTASVSIPAATVNLPGVVQRAQSVTITVPKNGGKVTFTIPQQTLIQPSQAVIPAATITAPITLSGTNLTFTLTLTAEQQQAIQTALSSGGAVTDIKIQLTQVAK